MESKQKKRLVNPTRQQQLLELQRTLKDKTNGVCLTVEEMNEAIAISRVEDDDRIRKGGT